MEYQYHNKYISSEFVKGYLNQTDICFQSQWNTQGFGQNAVKTIPQGYLTYDVCSELKKVRFNRFGCLYFECVEKLSAFQITH